MADTEVLVNAWVQAKKEEAERIEWRRRCEDALLKALDIDPALDGTENFEMHGHKVKIVGRMTRKVDSDKLQDIAAEHGLSEHLHALFRWKADINAANWKAADESITTPLLGAVTTSPGRPSFTITPIEEK
jgi:hypothetical protein